MLHVFRFFSRDYFFVVGMSNIVPKKMRAKWNESMDRCLLDEMIFQADQKGKRSDSGFKPEAWKAAADKVSLMSGTLCDKSQVKTRSCQVKSKIHRVYIYGFFTIVVIIVEENLGNHLQASATIWVRMGLHQTHCNGFERCLGEVSHGTRQSSDTCSITITFDENAYSYRSIQKQVHFDTKALLCMTCVMHCMLVQLQLEIM